ncbi:MAG TPA: histidine--tRNA ligase [Vicinamibacterales bacterium]|nr:histidine--tRNA ligase [Vicinamibacterales bacterium]
MTRTEPARGMRDYLPEDIRRREFVIGVIRRVYERYGFEPLETPAVENLETLMGKYGEEGNQLIFKILKRGEHEASGQADLALRYDLTVPLSRVVAHYQSKLPRLFKRYQIQPVWRADRPARGRFREFYQCDVDALGSTSPVIEAELCAAVAAALTELGFEDFHLRLNHRQLLTEILDAAGIPGELHGSALVALDKLDKIKMEGVAKEMTERGISAEAVEALAEVFRGRIALDVLTGNPMAGLQSVADFVSGADDDPPSIENLRQIFTLTQNTPAAGHVTFDPSLARGLSYYTGAIMEVNVPDLAGSLGGGGRYDNLVGMFLGQSVPACGFSLGLERILVVMAERGMFPPTLATTPADVMMAVFDAADAAHAVRVAGLLRQSGLRVMVYPDADKIGKQIKYADSLGIPFVAILGSNEIAAAQVTVKNLKTQTQATYDQAAAGGAILEGLKQRG